MVRWDLVSAKGESGSSTTAETRTGMISVVHSQHGGGMSQPSARIYRSDPRERGPSPEVQSPGPIGSPEVDFPALSPTQYTCNHCSWQRLVDPREFAFRGLSGQRDGKAAALGQGGGGLELRERGACAGLRCQGTGCRVQGAGSWGEGAGSRQVAGESDGRATLHTASIYLSRAACLQ